MPLFVDVYEDLRQHIRRAARAMSIELERQRLGLPPLAPPGALSLCDSDDIAGALTFIDPEDKTP